MISKKQYRKLRLIQLFNGTTAKDYGKRGDLYDYLKSKKLIKYDEVRGYRGYKVTEEGMAEMYTYRMEHFRFWFPSIVSVLALIASFLSIIASNPEFLKNVQEWLRAIF